MLNILVHQSDIDNALLNGLRKKQKPTRTADIEHIMEVSLEDMYTGTTRKLEFNQKVVCSPCGGRGTTDRSVNTTCSTCNGSGVEVKIVQFGPGMVSQTQQVRARVSCSV